MSGQVENMSSREHVKSSQEHVRSSRKHVRLSQETDMSSQEQEHVMYMLGQVGKMSCQGRTMSGPVRNM